VLDGRTSSPFPIGTAGDLTTQHSGRLATLKVGGLSLKPSGNPATLKAGISTVERLGLLALVTACDSTIEQSGPLATLMVGVSAIGALRGLEPQRSRDPSGAQFKRLTIQTRKHPITQPENIFLTYSNLRLHLSAQIHAIRCGLRVIAKPTLIEFWESRKGDSWQAEQDLTVWYKLATKASWKDFAALKQTFGSADQFGNCVVFDVGGNRYRLIGRVKYGSINYDAGKIFVLKVMDHKEYDKQAWKKQCGCKSPPPQSKSKPKKSAPEGRDK
jgi:mRNA interferase HigB